jgi:hypothetical protein
MQLPWELLGQSCAATTIATTQTSQKLPKCQQPNQNVGATNRKHAQKHGKDNRVTEEQQLREQEHLQMPMSSFSAVMPATGSSPAIMHHQKVVGMPLAVLPIQWAHPVGGMS